MNDLFNDFFDNFWAAPSIFPALETRAKVADSLSWPGNIIVEKDGSKTIEIAVVGKTKEDIEVSSHKDKNDGFNRLTIKIADTTKEDKEDDRKYEIHKIKNGKTTIEIAVENKYDLTKLTAKVENGLLTISIPVKEKAEEKALVYEVN